MRLNSRTAALVTAVISGLTAFGCVGTETGDGGWSDAGAGGGGQGGGAGGTGGGGNASGGGIGGGGGNASGGGIGGGGGNASGGGIGGGGGNASGGGIGGGGGGASGGGAGGGSADAGVPNFLIILTDDQRFDTVQTFMPQTEALIFNQGVEFRRGFSNTPLCCPGRSSLLTGDRARTHGVKENDITLTMPTLSVSLRAAGYRTAMIGKYLNSMPCSPSGEWDSWVCIRNGPYTNFNINVEGSPSVEPGYVTYVLRDKALAFLDSTRTNRKPWLLYFSLIAPHTPCTAAPGDENLYSSLPAHRPPSFNETNVADKPGYIAFLAPDAGLSSAQRADIDQERLCMLRSLKAVDRSVEALMSKLTSLGVLDNTFVVFVADNGYLWGEHRLRHKRRPYEESSRVPFAVRFPPLVRTPRADDHLVALFDLAPTIYELANVRPVRPPDGASLVPLLRNSTAPWRDELLLEGWPIGWRLPNRTDGWEGPPWQALRTAQWMYIDNVSGRDELYDMVNDPYQLVNMAVDGGSAAIVGDMRARLARYAVDGGFP